MKSQKARLIFTFLISFMIDIPTGIAIMGVRAVNYIAAASLMLTAAVVLFSEFPFLRRSIIIVPVFFIVFYRYIPNIMRGIATFLIWTAGFIYGDYPINIRYAYILMFISFILIGYCTYSLIQDKKYIFYIGLGGFSLLASQAYIGVDAANTAAYLLALVLIFLSVYFVDGFKNLHSNVWICSLVACTFVLSYFLPPAFKPAEIDKIKDLATVIFKNYTTSTGNVENTQEYVELGGPRNVDENVVMKVISPESTYLRGRVYDEYDGKGWHKGEYRWTYMDDNGHIKQPFDDQVSFRSIVQEITKYSPGELIFTSYPPLSIDLNSNSGYYIDEDYEVRSANAGEKSYEVTSAVPYVDFAKIRASGYDYPAEVKKYLHLPQGLPSRIGDFTAAITEGMDNPYDKVMAVQNYLRSMKYELNVPKTPPDRDFVDYFLFDLKEGYCTYFATAMTIMLRTQGIPARYVEGYVMPSEADSGTVYFIRNSMAHAWVEVYFNNFGWMSFDPTPLYNGFNYTPVSTQLNVIPEEPVIPDKEIRPDINVDELQGTPSRPNVERVNLYYWLVIPLTVCIIIIITHLRSYFLIKRLSKTKLVLYYSGKIINVLKHTGINIMDGETLREYSFRAKGVVELTDIINICEKTLYGNRPPLDEELDKVRLKYEDVLKVYKDKKGVFRYLLMRSFALI
ncbi:transglutaminase TgpA family protein [Calorimonas adulescens]|uniref:Transglutaminase-like domain-containing protein n=1 Tax=Calorimonas adulescens TaxID=2606906 RepID=A0A5D8QGB8_9THEO|nr:transglutaminase domain-containing protein [Calorimonas adulescens]TZE83204.1 hypothetical protein FWJ32_02495 [Calorimonas adulescens]